MFVCICCSHHPLTHIRTVFIRTKSVYTRSERQIYLKILTIGPLSMLAMPFLVKLLRNNSQSCRDGCLPEWCLCIVAVVFALHTVITYSPSIWCLICWSWHNLGLFIHRDENTTVLYIFYIHIISWIVIWSTIEVNCIVNPSSVYILGRTHLSV